VFSAAAGRGATGQIEKETNSSPQSSQRTLRKKIFYNLCALRVLCGEILLENGIGFHEVSYKGSGFSAAAGRERPVLSKKKLMNIEHRTRERPILHRRTVSIE